MGKVKYYLNDKDLGPALQLDKIKEGKWYPTVELVYQGDKVTFVNTIIEDFKMTPKELSTGKTISPEDIDAFS